MLEKNELAAIGRPAGRAWAWITLVAVILAAFASLIWPFYGVALAQETAATFENAPNPASTVEAAAALENVSKPEPTIEAAGPQENVSKPELTVEAEAALENVSKPAPTVDAAAATENVSKTAPGVDVSPEAAVQAAIASEGSPMAEPVSVASIIDFLISSAQKPSWIWAVAGLLIFAVALAIGRSLGKKPVFQPPNGSVLNLGQPGRPINAAFETDLLTGLFPSVWLSGANREALAAWAEKAGREAVSAYMEALGEADKYEGPEPLNRAAEKLGVVLRRKVFEGEWFEFLGEGPDKSIMRLHLNELAPPLRLPPPPLSVEPRRLAVAVAGGVGALAGNLMGAALARFSGQPLETGIMAGSVIGAAAAAALALWLSFNERARRAALLILGGVAALDTASRAALGPLAPIAGGGSFFKRLVFYAGAGAALIFIKAKPVLARGRAKENVSVAVANWLETVTVLAAVLRRKVGAPVGLSADNDDGELLVRIVPLVRTMLANPVLAESPALDELARRLANHGFDLASEPAALLSAAQPAVLVWEAGLSASYDTFGLIRAGQRVVVEEQPVIKDGRVVRKGMVALEK